MRAKIQSVPRSFVETSEYGGSLRAHPSTFDIQLIVTLCDESFEQVGQWFTDDVEFELVPVSPLPD